MNNEDIKFLRQRDYKIIQELGHGSCGRTVLLRDEEIEEDFVCKKYAPESEAWKIQLFPNFLKGRAKGVRPRNVILIRNSDKTYNSRPAPFD